MSPERYLRVRVFLNNGDEVEDDLIECISAQTQLLISEDFISLLQNKDGLLIRVSPTNALFIEEDRIHSFVSLN